MVDNSILTFSVSGMLWNRSLVMMDIETNSLWSHILGKAMDGKLKDSELEIIPSQMVTWELWLEQYPETSVLNLPRTYDAYTADFYEDPAEFVFGWRSGEKTYSISFDVLLENPVINLQINGWASLITFDIESTAVNIFSREIDGQNLYFVTLDKNLIRDRQTGSLWNQNTGIAIDGQLKGKKLDYQVGIVSYKEAWQLFHPDNKPINSESDIWVK